jgi:hypothetical protein
MKSGSNNSARQSLENQIERGEILSLDTVLADAELINECKWGNQKIIK